MEAQDIVVWAAGCLTTGATDDPVAAAGGAAPLDLAAALSWLRRNVAAFGGDPRRVTLAGHAAGAALVNALLMTPHAKGTHPRDIHPALMFSPTVRFQTNESPLGLVSRVLLLSGSALSPSALAPDASLAREHTAQALRCTADSTTEEHWLVPKSLQFPVRIYSWLADNARPTAAFTSQVIGVHPRASTSGAAGRGGPEGALPGGLGAQRAALPRRRRPPLAHSRAARQ